MQQDRGCFTGCKFVLLGNLAPSWSAKDDCLGPRRQVPKLLLEDLMHQDRNQALILFGIPSANRQPNGGHQPDAFDSPLRVDQEKHQGVGGMLTHHRVRLQPSKTFYWKNEKFTK